MQQCWYRPPRRGMSPGSDGSPVPAPLDPRIDFLAGTLAGIASLFVGHPLDTCKTRLQALSTASHYAPAEGTSRGAAASAMTVLRVMMKEEGIRGFYKGVVRPLPSSLRAEALTPGTKQ